MLTLAIALLRAGRLVAVCGGALALATLGIACLIPETVLRITCGGTAMVLVLAHAYYAIRIEIDLTIFADLLSKESALEIALDDFDASLRAIGLAAHDKGPRPLALRLLGVRRMLITEGLLAAASGVVTLWALFAIYL